MKIYREGKEIELTSAELFDAYVEQEHLFDIQNVVNNMENHLDEDEYEELKDNRDFIECAADELRRNQNKYDLNFYDALSYAIDDVIGQFLDIQKDVKEASVQTTWITVYKDSLGYSDDFDNLTQICVPTQWLYSLLKEDGEDIQSGEDIESWFSEYTADSTDIIARKALAEGQIHDCSDQNIKLSLFIDVTKEKTYKSLEASNKNKKTVDLDMNTSEYKSATDLISSFCQGTFPELYDAVFGNSNSDMFFEDMSGEYHMFYYNPDSNAGGQIVDCPFDVEQASRMFKCENYIDVLAENTQYLSDINTYHFFDSIFDLLERKKSGLFLGTDRDTICKAICEKHGIEISANKKPSLTAQIQSASARTQSSKNSPDIKSKETEPIL